MKRSLLAGALALLMLPVAVPAATTAKPDIDPAVWVLKDEDTTIYFFGTFHLLDGKSEWFNDEVKAAFDASQELYLEILTPDDPAAMQALIMKYALDMSGKTLSSRLTPEAKKELAEQLAEAKLPAGALEMFEP
jgi:uncharacterized protein YbaP (TraB family)